MGLVRHNAEPLNFENGRRRARWLHVVKLGRDGAVGGYYDVVAGEKGGVTAAGRSVVGVDAEVSRLDVRRQLVIPVGDDAQRADDPGGGGAKSG